MSRLNRSVLLAVLCCILLLPALSRDAQAEEFVGSVVIENGEFNGITEPLIGPGRLSYNIYTKCFESIDILVMDEENAEKYLAGEACTIVEGASVTGTWNASVQGVNLGTGGYVIVFDNTDAFSAKPSQNIGSSNVTVYYDIEYTGIQESSDFFKDINLWTNANMQCIAGTVIVLVILIGVFAGKKRSSSRYYMPPPEHAQQPAKRVTVTRRYYKMPPQEGMPPDQRRQRPPGPPPY